jgi:hypothetical protein
MFGTPAGASARPRLVIAPPVSHYAGAASPANRIDALTKLKSLLDSGVLTPAQYRSELARLTGGI